MTTENQTQKLLYIIIISCFFNVHTLAQADRFKGVSKKEIQQLLLSLEHYCDSVYTVQNYTIEILENNLNVRTMKINDLQNQLSELRTSYLMLNKEKDKLAHELTTSLEDIDSLLSVCLLNENLEKHVERTDSEWNNMGLMEKIKLISNESNFDHFLLFSPDLQHVLDHEALNIASRCAPPYYMCGPPCLTRGLGDFYQLTPHWYIELWRESGDWETSPYVELTLTSPTYSDKQINLMLNKSPRIYISDSGTTLISKTSNPCGSNYSEVSASGMYEFLYINGNIIGSCIVEVDNFDFEDEYEDWYPDSYGIEETDKSISFNAYVLDGPGSNQIEKVYQIFTISTDQVWGENNDTFYDVSTISGLKDKVQFIRKY